jgi:pyridoxal phosphate enzyme (YggS family)
MITLAERLQRVRGRIEDARRAAGRPEQSVRLLAVSKTQGADQVREALAAGQTAFGESYLQEALAKMAELQATAIEWHFIGPIQSNKTAQIASHFDWVHSIDRLKIAQRLNEQRAELPPLNVCIQVNISGESSKSGVSEAGLPALAAAILKMPNLRLRGLMTIPAPNTDRNQQAEAFRRLRHCLERLNQQGMALDTLSMGMSNDLEAAIAEGATIVRIGTAVFGPRQPRKH